MHEQRSNNVGERPGLVLTCALLSMSQAGTVYWVPSLFAALATPLSLSNAAVALLVSAPGAAFMVTIFAGLLHQRIGPRATSVIGSLGVSTTYAGVACVLRGTTDGWLPRPAVVPLLLFAVFSISLASYGVYGSSQSAAVAAFPRSRRGEINALMSGVFAMSSGMYSAIQAGFFPSLSRNDLEKLLWTASAGTILPVALSLVAYPKTLDGRSTAVRQSTCNDGSEIAPAATPTPERKPSTGNGSDADAHLPLLQRSSVNDASHLSSGGHPDQTGYKVPSQRTSLASEHADTRVGTPPAYGRVVRLGYFAAGFVAAVLQLCAYAEWRGNEVVPFLQVRLQTASAGLLFIAFCAMLLPAASEVLLRHSTRQAHSNVSAQPEPLGDGAPPHLAVEAATGENPDLESHTDEQRRDAEAGNRPSLTLAELAGDIRFLYISLALTCVPAAAGLTLLNTAQGLVGSRLVPQSAYDSVNLPPSVATASDVASGVRTIVLLFSASGVLGRLSSGLFMDNPPTLWKKVFVSDAGLPRALQNPDDHAVRWRYDMLQLVAVFTALGMGVCSFSRGIHFLSGALVVFIAHGIFFAVLPAVTQDLLGLNNFARDFALAVSVYGEHCCRRNRFSLGFGSDVGPH